MAKPLSSKSLLGPRGRHGKFLFDEAIGFFSGREVVRVVELGGIRDPRTIARDADGWSTVSLTAKSNFRVTSVDKNPAACKVTRSLAPLARVVCGDGIEYLASLPDKSVDLLYMDGPDATEEGKQWHLKLAIVAIEKMSDACVILIDDCDFKDGGKGAHVVPYLSESGFRMVHDNVRQKMFVRAE
jgi:hypothetical protein